MLDFFKVSVRQSKTEKGVMEVYPKFIVKESKDLMIRGGQFYAIWNEDEGLWSTDNDVARALIDRELDIYCKEHAGVIELRPQHLWDSDTGMIDKWNKYCQKQMWDSYHSLDERLIFSDTPVSKEDYASKRLSYSLTPGPCPNYEELMGTLYSPEEKEKLEWAVGCIVTGDSKNVQKFIVLYGDRGTGKSTFLNIVEKLFGPYICAFNAAALGNPNNAFALEPFKSNPLIAIEHDGNLSRIEDNTRLNSIVSHETMTINAKFEKLYSTRFNSFLFVGSNKPVKITDAKSGLLRRLIDVSPTGKLVSRNRYDILMHGIDFELGAIACKCRDVYLEDTRKYDKYIPVGMMGSTNYFYNYVLEMFDIFKEKDETTLKFAWTEYKKYCDDAKVPYPLSMQQFKEELKNYFLIFVERDANHRNWYSIFLADKFSSVIGGEKEEPRPGWIHFVDTPSKLDDILADCPAQLASVYEKPTYKWADVKTTLRDINTRELHYVKSPEWLIVIDFDIPDENGEKSLEKNLAAANAWPPTYAELSKSGSGIHLHYIYRGDTSKLAIKYADNVEIKVFSGNSSLRRKLTLCTENDICELNSGLPMKGEKKVVSNQTIKNEKALRNLINKHLRKEIMGNTKPSIQMIAKILDEAYANGVNYDISDMYGTLMAFAAQSSNSSDYCMKVVDDMKLTSEKESAPVNSDDLPLIFFDVEVFPNLFLVNWKKPGYDAKVHRMINPSPRSIEDLCKKYRLVGFNNRRYDNHILYGRMMGFNNEELYSLSQRIIVGKDRSAFFREAYNLSYTDIYDFASKKQSLKKWEIELGISHKELGLPWDEPVPESEWERVAQYCDNDVFATESVWNARQADFLAREILAAITGLTVNDTTNTHSTRMIFGDDRTPQSQFNYRDMGNEVDAVGGLPFNIWDADPDWTKFDSKGRPIFPGYTYKFGKSEYRGEDPKEGGYVYAEPGIYYNVALLDIASMHPHSIIAENLFGDIYTKRFEELVDARIAIKHGEFDTAKKLLDGKLAPFLEDESKAKDLSNALKIVINSVYGLTSAKFDNPFRDPRNIDNIVAKRGALFMINLKHEVQRRGYTVAHIKTDSIKIPNADEKIIDFVMRYGEAYGYHFEHEATYERMCLVNDAVYIAKYDISNGGEWTATGTQFAVPYVFKTLFTKEPIGFPDLCETKEVKSALYLDLNEGYPDVSKEEKELDKKEKALNAMLKDISGDVSMDAANALKGEVDLLRSEVAKGHNYIFIGRVGLFSPVVEGVGGGALLREQNGKFYSVAGTKGFKWLESDVVKTSGLESSINRTYYDILADEARATINEFGDFYKFAEN